MFRLPWNRKTVRAHRPERRARLGLEHLEKREVPSVVPLFPEIEANGGRGSNDGSARHSDIGVAADGSFVTVFQRKFGAYLDEFDVIAQRHAADGTRIGDPIEVAYGGADDRDAAIAVRADGSFIVTWVGNGPQGSRAL
jgi:hypothetical protein